MSINERQLLSLAGVFQAANLAKSLANSGRCDMQALEYSVQSLLNTSPQSFSDVFADKHSVMLGLKSICSQLGPSSRDLSGQANQRRDMDVIRYATSLLSLEKKYAKQRQLQQQLADGLDALIIHKETLGVTEPAMLGRLGQLYLETISVLKPAIMVTGKPIYLKQDQIVSSVRTALLCGIRAASLWRSEGGSMWKLMFSWKSILRQCQHLSRNS